MRLLLLAAAAAVLAMAAAPVPASEVRLRNGQGIALEPGHDRRSPARFEMSGSGSLVIEADGRVSDVVLDLHRSVRRNFREAISTWRFAPVEIDGRVVRAKAHFQIEVFGTPIAGTDRVQLGVKNVWFLDPPTGDAEAGAHATSHLAPPSYPSQAALEAYGATVLLLLKIDAEGRVADAGVADLTLDVWGVRDPARAERFALRFAERSLTAARNWTFAARDDVPLEGTVLVPVTFIPPQRPRDGWRPQVDVHVEALPWMLAAQAEAVSLTAGGGRPSTRFQLLDEVAGTTVN